MTEAPQALESNVLRLPWVNVVDRTGLRRSLSLKEVFRLAPELLRLDGDLPTQDAAVLRFLVAVVLVAVADPDWAGDDLLEAWKGWWEDWDSLADRVEAYLDEHAGEFDLLHPAKPFLQTAGLEPQGKLEPGLDRIIPDVAQWFSARDAARPLPLAEAPRWLLHVQGYSVAGIHTGQKGDPSVKGGRGYPNGFPAWLGNVGLVLFHGENLAQTILLNLPLDAAPDERRAGWQLERGVASVRNPAPHGIAELLVWPSRRVRLHVDDGGLIRTVQVSYGDMITPYDKRQFEPMTTWRRSENLSKREKRDVLMPVQHDATKQVWRGLGALLAIEGERPATAAWLDTLRTNHVLDGRMVVRLQVVGMEYGPQNSSVQTIIDDAVEAPLAALVTPVLAGAAQEAADLARRVVGALTTLAANLATATGADEEHARERAARAGYSAIDPAYREWLRLLQVPAEADHYVVAWHSMIRRVALQAGEELVRAAGGSGIRGRTVDGRRIDSAQAWAEFWKSIVRLTDNAHRARIEEQA